VVGGSAIAIALGAIADASLGVAAGVGGVAPLVPLLLCSVTPTRLLEERAGRHRVDLPLAVVASEFPRMSALARLRSGTPHTRASVLL
jgi:hypothetical protein